MTVLRGVAATYGDRIEGAERRPTAIEADRSVEFRRYQSFKAGIRSDLAEIKADLKWIRATFERH